MEGYSLKNIGIVCRQEYNSIYTYLYISENCGHPRFIIFIKDIKNSPGLYWVAQEKKNIIALEKI